jgi:predicted RNase H-like nuclease
MSVQTVLSFLKYAGSQPMTADKSKMPAVGSDTPYRRVRSRDSTVNDVPTRQTMYVSRNMEARSCNHCCRGKAINITYSELVLSMLRNDLFTLIIYK